MSEETEETTKGIYPLRPELGAHFLSSLSQTLIRLNPNSRGNPNSVSLVKRAKTNKQNPSCWSIESGNMKSLIIKGIINWNLNSRDNLENQVKSVQTL